MMRSHDGETSFTDSETFSVDQLGWKSDETTMMLGTTIFDQNVFDTWISFSSTSASINICSINSEIKKVIVMAVYIILYNLE